MSDMGNTFARATGAVMRHRGLAGAAALVLALAGCQSMNGAPEVQEASFNQSSIAHGLYRVQRGDTIYSIAWRTGVDYHQLARLNDIQPPYNLTPGQTLRLNSGASVPQDSSPGSSGSGDSTGTRAIALDGSDSGGTGGASSGDDSWLAPDEEAMRNNRTSGSSSGGGGTTVDAGVAGTVAASGGQQRTDSGSASAGQGQTSDDRAGDGERAGSGQGSSAAQSGGAGSDTADGGDQGGGDDTGGTAVAGKSSSDSGSQQTYTPAKNIDWQWPTDGQVVGTFKDKTDLTPGIDIAGQKGQPVMTAGPGIVVYAGSGVHGYGKLIILKHNDQFLSAYAHNQTLRVEENDVVSAGDVIATMGSSDADRTELHFEIRQDGQPKDPMTFLPNR
ncbi:LysM domain-containing protein [Kushneria sinocarnis]|uniref:LysM domain-containing protein n=1 Tax=Kushneria sinocarnis TaxID=595502 RepID=A0A420WX13_9GAMM|nr:peptidoglycan DD-metalloendopeptidase family protein [Kushneria sinocarnis]RKR04270.1 LysM domain-containing protein [Kushneria sinocarnis]